MASGRDKTGYVCARSTWEALGLKGIIGYIHIYRNPTPDVRLGRFAPLANEASMLYLQLDNCKHFLAAQRLLLILIMYYTSRLIIPIKYIFVGVIHVSCLVTCNKSVAMHSRDTIALGGVMLCRLMSCLCIGTNRCTCIYMAVEHSG